MEIKINFCIQSVQWRSHPEINTQLIEKVLKTTISCFDNLRNLNYLETSIFLSNNSYIKFLNNRYLDKNKPTNVLAFPKIKLHYKDLYKHDFKLLENKINLGDVILSYNFLLTESNKLSISFLKHFVHLLAHGILHLLGFDHIKKEDAQVMESLEQTIITKILNSN